MRNFHSISGLLIALLACILAFSGAFLALQPSLELAANKTSPAPQISVAQLAHKVAIQQPDVERMVRTANGIVFAYGDNDLGNWKLVIDPAAGAGSPAPKAGGSTANSFMIELHRSLFLGDRGRLLTGVSAGLLLLLTLSGAYLLVKRCGGLRNIFAATTGTPSQRLHIGVGKATVVALVLSSATGLYMSLANFGMVPDGSNIEADYPASVAGTTPVPIAQMEALQRIPANDLRELTFPFVGDREDVFAITTGTGQGYVDQATGSLISFAPYGFGQRLYETVYMLHTGENGGWATAILALILGVSVLGLPALAVTGITVWWTRKSRLQKIQNNAPATSAETIILVGSQGNATWAFANTLHTALKTPRQKVHLCALNDMAHDHCGAKNLLILTSTYGDGDAPATADRFIENFSKLTVSRNTKVAVLGFGDTRYSNYCGFAEQVEKILEQKGIARLMEMHTINRQCPHAFRLWGAKLGTALNLQLALNHTPQQPKNCNLVLQELVKNKPTGDADIAILRFSVPQIGTKTIAYSAGDLLGITPPGDASPRFYSLASSSSDGFVEICVKRHKQGQCSNYLHDLRPGAEIQGFIKTNPMFRPPIGTKPVILIGAGTGMAPLAGFARHNTVKRPMFLFWGGRNPKTDFIYQQQIMSCLKSRHLSSMKSAFSKGPKQQYVQDRLAEDARMIRIQIQNDAQILVCGGRPMAAAVRATIDQILEPLNLSVRQLQHQNRYLEDVY